MSAERVQEVCQTLLGLACVEISEGQAVQRTGLDRIAVRVLHDALMSMIAALQTEDATIKQAHMRQVLIDLAGERSEAALQAHAGYAVGHAANAPAKSVNGDWWFSYECVDPDCCRRLAVVLDTRLNDETGERDEPKIQCPGCSRNMSYTGRWAADRNGFGSRGDQSVAPVILGALEHLIEEALEDDTSEDDQ